VTRLFCHYVQWEEEQHLSCKIADMFAFIAMFPLHLSLVDLSIEVLVVHIPSLSTEKSNGKGLLYAESDYIQMHCGVGRSAPSRKSC